MSADELRGENGRLKRSPFGRSVWVGDRSCGCHLCHLSEQLDLGIYTGNAAMIEQAANGYFEYGANKEIELFGVMQERDSARAEVDRLRAHLNERTAQRDALEAVCRRLMAAYEAEEDEDGFPFSFELRDAHRALQALLADPTEDTP